jgi:Predicted nucleotide-binding protein containing TIR-like domain
LADVPKPQVFIGSSTESWAIATAVQARMAGVAHCTVWDQGVFPLGGYTLETLIASAGKYDFALFIFGADDLAEIRGQTLLVTRDNVVLELGLFMGVLGRERVFVLQPGPRTGAPPMHLPSDLAGLTTGVFDATRPDENWLAEVAPFCQQVTKRIESWRVAQSETPHGDDNRDITGVASIDERFVIRADSTRADVRRITYKPMPATISIRGSKVEASGHMISSGALEFDGQVAAQGVYYAGIAYMTYTAVDERQRHKFKGLLLVRVPPMGKVHGLWLTDDHIDPGVRSTVVGDFVLEVGDQNLSDQDHAIQAS